MAEQNFYGVVSAQGKTKASRTSTDELDTTLYTKYGDIEVVAWNATKQEPPRYATKIVDAWCVIKVRPHHGASQHEHELWRGKISHLLQDTPLQVIRRQLEKLTPEQRVELFQELAKYVVVE